MRRIVYKWIGVVVCIAMTVRATADDGLWQRFLHPSVEARTKVWWFHGETETTREGIDADLSAFQEKGIGGVVYYDQVHGKAEGAFPSMSLEWWQMLKYAAKRAQELGLSFEVATGNGYVSGGPWITPELGMRRVDVVDTVLTVDRRQTMDILLPAPMEGFTDVATLLFPDRMEWQPICMSLCRHTLKENEPLTIDFDAGRDVEVSAVSYLTNPRGKGSTSSMNIPGMPQERYFGAMYQELPPLGELEYSSDGQSWYCATVLRGVENVIGYKSKERTISFPQVKGRYFRIRLHDWMDAEGRFRELWVEHVRLACRDCVDNWQVKSGLRTEICYPHPVGGERGAIPLSALQDVSSRMDAGGRLRLTLEPGTWHLLRFGHVPTGGRTKHGRRNLLGLEAGVMSAKAARTHYEHYFKAILDTLSAIGCRPQGMCMDSHEAGAQNWTEGFEKRFKVLRGYDLVAWMPALAGYIVESRERTEQVLMDFRKSIAETIRSEYYGTFAELCRTDGVEFTSQCMLNIETDNIANRSRASKPQGEFWAYQKNGNYDCLDASSAAHLYGRLIASGEAFTDTPYSASWDELLRVANLAYCQGINEFVVCASSYQPWLDRKYDDSSSAHPYVFHRLHPHWEQVAPFWEYQARCSQLLREGSPVVDLCVYLGEDPPMKTLAYKLPVMPEGYKFDVCTWDALAHRMSAREGVLAVEGGMSYRALVVQDRTWLSSQAKQYILSLERQGVPVIWCNRGESVADGLRKRGIFPDLGFHSGNRPDDRLCFFHRRTDGADIYFVYNHSCSRHEESVTVRTPYRRAEWWDPLTAERRQAEMDADKTLHLSLQPYQALFLIVE